MRSKGFTLIELLVVIVIIGIIAAIAIPNLMTALQKGRQKATMGDMKNIGIAVEEYAVDNHMAPGAGAVNRISDIQVHLVPFYVNALPIIDSWNNPFYYQSGAPTMGQGEYSIYSYGRDRMLGVIDITNSQYIVSTIEQFNNDICFSNGSFTYAPKVK